VLLIVSTGAFASSGNPVTDYDADPVAKRSTPRFTSARADLLYGLPLPVSEWSEAMRPRFDGEQSTRIVPLAFGLSVIVPGLGQAYNRDWIAGGIFVAIEVALIAAYVGYNNSGNTGIDEYEQFANANWSPIQYAQWLNDYSGYNGGEVLLPSLTEQDFMHPEQWSAAQRAEVDDFFLDIRDAERSSIYLTTGATFSHVLPFFGEQQYYELIGKYFQYATGWTDYEGNPDDDPVAVMPDDANFYFYSDIHAAANDELRKASMVGAFLLINHFAAGVQAAVSAKLYNARIQPNISLGHDPAGDLITKAGLAISW